MERKTIERRWYDMKKERMNHCDRKVEYKRSQVYARGNKYEIERFNERYGRR